MNAAHLLLFGPLVLGLGVAVYTDCAARRIPNWLTFTLAIGGIANALVWSNPIAPGWACLGLLLGFGLMTAKFVLGAAGGGDVKIMAAIGAWVGPLAVLQVFLLYQVLGIAVVLIQAIRAGRLTALFRNSMVLTVNVLSLRQVGRDHVMEVGRESRSLDHYMPDALPIAAAVLIVLAANALSP